MKFVRWVLAAALVAAVLTGCSLFQGKVLIVNNSSHTIDTVFISPIDDSLWGDDWLTTTISPGYSHEFHGISPGSYDLRAETTLGAAVENRGIEIEANKTYTWTLTN